MKNFFKVITSILILQALCDFAMAESKTIELKKEEQTNGPCDALLRATSSYDQLEEGELKQKISVGQVTDWSRSSRYKNLALIDTQIKKPSLVVTSSFIKGKKLVLKEFKEISVKDKKYLQATQDVRAFFPESITKENTYTISIFSDTQKLCEQKWNFLVDGK